MASLGEMHLTLWRLDAPGSGESQGGSTFSEEEGGWRKGLCEEGLWGQQLEYKIIKLIN